MEEQKYKYKGNLGLNEVLRQMLKMIQIIVN